MACRVVEHPVPTSLHTIHPLPLCPPPLVRRALSFRPSSLALFPRRPISKRYARSDSPDPAAARARERGEEGRQVPPLPPTPPFPPPSPSVLDPAWIASTRPWGSSYPCPSCGLHQSIRLTVPRATLCQPQATPLPTGVTPSVRHEPPPVEAAAVPSIPSPGPVMASSSFLDSINSLGWSRRNDEAPVNTSQQSGLLSSIRSLNPFQDRGYVRLPTTESAGAPLPAPTRREEEGWFVRESNLTAFSRGTPVAGYMQPVSGLRHRFCM